MCVDRAEAEVGTEEEMAKRKKQRLTHILPRPFILFHRVRSVSNQKAGAPFGSARPCFFSPSISLFLSARPPLCAAGADKRTGCARAHEDKGGV